ncbi:MAG: hypothetical protein V1816_12410 [Pseudomonadota bacterium]
MTTARKEMVPEGVEGVYHCISRCVRRAFLCGQDPYTGKSFEHRKEWVRSRLEFLGGVFGVEIGAFAVMSNHLHVVLRTRPDLVDGWDDEDVAGRWRRLFPKNRDEKGASPDFLEAAAKVLAGKSSYLEEIRRRLASVSWFMRCLNEPVARMANKEDGCKGRFWEGRFKCQTILDDSALLACLAYVDLNPVRAGMAETLETCEFTSMELRITAWRAELARKTGAGKKEKQAGDDRTDVSGRGETSNADAWLCPLGLEEEEALGGRRPILNISIEDYLNILDWSGRQIRGGSSGALPRHLSPILTRLQVNEENWLETAQQFGRKFFGAAGAVDAMTAEARRLGKNWLRGYRAGGRAFF